MKKECSTCGGSGQIGSFLGVSRFLITWEECPACCGTGYVEQQGKKPDQKKKKTSKKGRG